MMRCQQCHGIEFKVIESRLLLSGTRRRRWGCTTCGHRWTTKHHGEAPARQRRSAKPRQPGGVRSLTNEQAASIMLSPLSNGQLALQYDLTPQAIASIKAGRNYRDVYAALGLSRQGCQSCQHWIDAGCSFQFPEAGGSFAKHCTLYEPQP